MSEVKVNKISPRTNCGTVTLGDSGDSFAVAASASFKTKEVKDASGNIIISRCGSNITIGSSGAAVALAAGATQSGFGRTGTVNWDTTAKTTTVTAVSGVGYFINTTSGGVTVNLPAGTAGDIVAVSDYANTSATNSITITPNGTDKINGTNASYYLSTNGASVTFVYVDSTRGWKDINDATLNATGIVPAFVAATGGTVITCGDYKTHVFTGPGTFCVSAAGNAAGSNSVEYLVVAGGGGAGRSSSGGGAGGLRTNVPSPQTAGVPVTIQGYPISVGGGGAGGTSDGAPAAPQKGTNSSGLSFTATGGGGGGNYNGPSTPGDAGGNGGSGGGAAIGGGPGSPKPGGTGNQGGFSPSEGNPGGSSSSPNNPRGGGGGGGAGAAGTPGTPGCSSNGVGGIGLSVPTAFVPASYGTPGPAPGRYFAGGGSGNRNSGTNTGGAGGGGPGGCGATGGTTNTGGGAGALFCGNGAAGGSGIVVIRYKFQ